MRKLQVFVLLAFSLIFTVTINSQILPEADVTRNVNLRVDPSTTKPPIVLSSAKSPYAHKKVHFPQAVLT
jgi:hypothetical protein